MADSRTYQLDISVRIVAIDPKYGGPVGGGGLEVREEARLSLNSFMEVAGVLARFHELTEAVKAAKEPVT